MKPFGMTLAPGHWTPARSVIDSRVETSASGNVIVRVGREHHRPVQGGGHGGWEVTEHVVLAPDEAIRLATKLLAAVVDEWHPDAHEQPIAS